MRSDLAPTVQTQRTGWCGRDIPLDHVSHTRCTPERTTPTALLVCPCDCHAQPTEAPVDTTTPAPTDGATIPPYIVEPTVIPDLDDADYHGHKTSLSASGAKLLAPPTCCPAKYRWRLDNREFKDSYDFGHVAHRLILGKGQDIEVLPYDSFQPKAPREARDDARAAGRSPILAKDHAKAVTLAGAVRGHDIAGPLFADGEAELSLFWPDPRVDGVTRRARLDWLTPAAPGRRRFIVDLKTARSSEPDAFGRAAADYGYAISAAQYVDGAIACGLADDPAYLLVVVEKDEPHVVSVFQVDDDLLQLGRALLREATRVYAECTATDTWPGYLRDVAPLELPGYYINKIEDFVS